MELVNGKYIEISLSAMSEYQNRDPAYYLKQASDSALLYKQGCSMQCPWINKPVMISLSLQTKITSKMVDPRNSLCLKIDG